MALTDAEIRRLKPGSKIMKISDGGGLQLRVETTGTKRWVLAYRFNGKQKELALGVYPTISLAAARTKRDEAKVVLANGFDPSEKRKTDRIEQQITATNTFALVAEEFLAKAKRENKASTTLKKMHWLLQDLAGPLLGNRPLPEVTPPEVLAVLRSVEKRGNLETARRLRSSIGSVFRYGIATGRCTMDPTQALQGALTVPKVKHRAAIVEPIPFGGLLRAVWSYDGQPEVTAALKLIALLHSRPGELRMAHWSEFDLDGAVWTIPAARTKMRREHKTPLATQVVEILRALKPISGHSKLVFPGLRTNTRPISENTLNAALRRLGYSPEQHTAHGFRASFTTLANESGKWSVDAIERHMAHQEENAVRRAYSRGSHWEERKHLCKWWADYCDALRQGAEIVPFNSGRAG